MRQSIRFSQALCAASLALACSKTAQATWVDVNVNTSTLIGETGVIYFDLTSGGSGVVNTSTISSFSTDGSLLSGPLTGATGSESGSLPGTVTLDTSSFFSEWAQTIQYGSNFSFWLNLSQNGVGVGNTPDAFSLFVQDGSGNLIPTTDVIPGANSLFLFNIDGTSTGYLNTYLPDPNAQNPATWTAVVAAPAGGAPAGPGNSVPEPSSLWLLAIGIIGILTNRKFVSAV